MTVILCGHKLVGKTTVANACSQSLGCDFIDTDALIINAFQRQRSTCLPLTVRAVYQALGDSGFRKLESAIIKTLKPNAYAIIAVGGGALLSKENATYLASLGTILYLKISRSLLQERWLAVEGENSENLKTMLRYDFDQREAIYQAVSQAVVEVDHRSVNTIVKHIKPYVAYYGQ